MSAGKIRPVRRACAFSFYMGILYGSFSDGINIRQHRTIPALRLKHRSGSCGTASALPKCSIMSGCGTRIVLRGQKPLALCDRCPCFGSLFPPLAALTFAASSIICAFGLASAAPRSPYRHLELCGIAIILSTIVQVQLAKSLAMWGIPGILSAATATLKCLVPAGGSARSCCSPLYSAAAFHFYGNTA